MLKNPKLTAADVDIHVQELETVAKVSAAAATILDPDKLLQTVADLVKTNFSLYHAQIYLLDESGKTLELAAGASTVGHALKLQGHSIELNREHSLVARAARSRQGVIANDVTREPDFLSNPLLPNTRSEMAIPMIVGDQLVGVLDVQASINDRFSDDDIRVKTILAEQIAVAIQNANAFRRIQKAEAETRRLVTLSLDMIGTAGFDGYLKELNPAWEQTLGYTLDELRAVPFISFVHPDDIEKTNSKVADELAAGASIISFENRYRAKDGSYHWMSWNAVPLLEEGLMYFVTRDVTAQKQAEEQTQRLSSLSVDMIGTAGFDGYLKDMNPAWERTLGYTRDELRAAPFASFIHPDDVDRTNEEFAREIAAGATTISFENRYRTKDGTYRWLSWNAVPFVEDGLIYCVTRDVTEQKRVEEETRQRATELETVAKVSAAAVSNLDLDVLLQTVSDLVKSNFNLYHAQIYLLDESGKTLELAAGAGDVGRALKQRSHSIELNREHSLVARAARSRHGAIASNVTLEPDFLANPLLPDTRSEMAIPMVIGDTLVGVLDVQASITNRFSDEDIRVKTILAEQIAVAVQNANAFSRMQKAEAETRRLVGGSLDLIGTAGFDGYWKDMNPALEQILGYTLEEFRAAPFVSFLHPDDVAKTDTVVADQLAIGLPTISFENRYRAKDGSFHLLSWNAVPALDEGLMYCVGRDITVQKQAEEANQALQQETVLLYSVSNRLTSARNPQELLSAVSDYSFSQGASRTTLMYIDLDDNGNPGWTETVAEARTDKGRSSVGSRYKLANFGIAKLWMTSPETPLLIPNTQDREVFDEATCKLFSGLGEMASVIMPLYLHGHWVGLSSCAWDKPHAFTEQDKRIYTSMSGQLAAVVDAVRSNEALQTAKQETDLLYSVSSRLTGAKTRQELLAAVSDYAISQGGSGATLLYTDLDDNGDPEWVEVVAEVHTIASDTVLPLGTRARLLDFAVAKLLIASPEMSVLVPDKQNRDASDQTTFEIFNQLGDMASVFMPLYQQGRWVGLATCRWDMPKRFTEQDQRIYTAMSGQLAAVVDAVRSNEALQTAKQETDLLYNVSSHLTGAKTRQELLDAVSEYAIDQGGSGSTLFYIDLDEAGDPEWLEVVAETHTVGEGFAIGGRFKLADFSIAKLWKASPETPLLFGDTQHDEVVDPPSRAVYAQTGQMAVAIMPLYLQGRWVGLAQCNWDKPQHFTEQDKRIYTAMGSQLAAVVDAIRSNEALQAANQETELLYNVSSRLAVTNSRQDLLTTISDYAINQGGSGASLLYIDLGESGAPEWLEVVAETHTVGEGFPVGTRFKLADFAIARLWMASPEAPLLISDTQNSEMVDPPSREVFLQSSQMASVLMPLYQQGHWVGLVVCQWDTPQHFTEKDQRIYTAMGSQLSAVVDALRSSEALQAAKQETEQRANELETVAEVSTAAASVLDIDSLLKTVVDLTKSRFNLYHAHIYLVDADAKMLVLIAGAGEVGDKMKTEGRSIALDNLGSLVARAGRARIGVIENDVTQAPDFLPNPYLPHTRAELAIPLVVGDRLIGVLDIQSEVANRFAASDVSIMNTLAGQIAVAVQNARSYQQQVQLVDQLQTVDKLKSEFLASMSHELRTPLNSIIGYSRMMLDGVDGVLGDEMVEDMDAIHSSGQHLLHLINDILDLAKIEADRLEIDQEKIEFSTIAEEVTRMTSVLLKDKPVKLIQDIDPQLPSLWADPIRLRQVLNNLVSNSIKFTEQGEIRITAKPENDIVVIGVHDTGMGISPDQLERVFERFHQTDTSSTRKAGGTGLGLTISRHLVEMHGGKVWAESTLGQGTSFWFSMPTATA